MGQATVNRPIWVTTGQEKRARVRQMFSEIASVYDGLNDVISFRSHRRWRVYAVRQLQLKAGDKVLDLCCGTGAFGKSLRKAVGPSGKILGLDFAEPMLRIAAEKNEALVMPVLADALSIPCPSNAFAGVTVGWGIRNVVDIDRAHEEIFRVIRPGGRFVSVEMAQPQNPLIKAASRLGLRLALPLLGFLSGRATAYTYLPESTVRLIGRQELVSSMQGAGFKNVSYRDYMFGNICMHWGEKP